MYATSRAFRFAYHHGESFFYRVDQFFASAHIVYPLLSTTRKVLKIISHFLKGKAEYLAEYEALKKARSALFDVHVILVWPRAPKQFYKAGKKSVKIAKSIPKIYKQWRNEGEIPKEELYKLALRVLYVFNHIAGGINKAIIKPLKVVDKYADLGKFSSKFGKGTKIFSLVRRGGKICHLTGKIIQGKKVKKRLVQLFFQIPAALFDAFELANLEVNPLFALSFGLIKSIFELVTCWEKTSG